MPKNVQTTQRLLLNDKTLGFLASGGDKLNLVPETRLDRSDLMCNQVLLKYEEDREGSDIGIIRGQKSTPFLVFSSMLYSQ